MRRDVKNLIYHELIGLHAVIADHTDRTLRGCEGAVVDESMNTLTVGKDGKYVKIPKLGARIIFKLPDKDVEVFGEMLVGRPEDRVKRCRGVTR